MINASSIEGIRSRMESTHEPLEPDLSSISSKPSVRRSCLKKTCCVSSKLSSQTYNILY